MKAPNSHSDFADLCLESNDDFEPYGYSELNEYDDLYAGYAESDDTGYEFE